MYIRLLIRFVRMTIKPSQANRSAASSMSFKFSGSGYASENWSFRRNFSIGVRYSYNIKPPLISRVIKMKVKK